MKFKSTIVVILALAFCCAYFRAKGGEDVSDARDAFFENHTIPRIRIQIEPSAVASLETRMREYAKATVYEGTNIYKEVGIHLKGQYGTFQKLGGKPSLTLNFDKFVKPQRFHGLDKLHLNNSIQDPSFLCELIGRHLFNKVGVPTGRATHARVYLNERDIGLYVLIEGYDRGFLKRNFTNPDGNLYDSEFRHEISEPIKRSRGTGTNDHADLLALSGAAADLDHQERMARVSDLLDLERFYKMMAVEVLIYHQDGYSMGINNYRVYFDPASRRATFLPGGMDQLFNEPAASVGQDPKGIMAKAVLETKAGRNELRGRCRMIYTSFYPDLLNFIRRCRESLRPVLSEMDPRFAQHTDEAATNLINRIRHRDRHLGVELSMAAHVEDFSQKDDKHLTNWIPTWQGTTTIMKQTKKDGQFVLEMTMAPGDSGVARWQALMIFQPGSYLFSAVVSTDRPVFRGPEISASLDIWGMTDLQLESQRINPTRVLLKCKFEAPTSAPAEYLLRCSSKGLEETVTYRFEAPHVTKLD